MQAAPAPPPPQSQYLPQQTQYANNGQKMAYPTPEQQQQFMQNYAYMQANNPAAQQQRMALYFSTNNAQNFANAAAGQYQLIGIPAQQYNPNSTPTNNSGNANVPQQQQEGAIQYAAGAQSQANMSTLWQMCQQDFSGMQMAQMPQMVNAAPPPQMPTEMYHQQQQQVQQSQQVQPQQIQQQPQQIQQNQAPTKTSSTTTTSPLNTATEEDSSFASEKHDSGKAATGSEVPGKDENCGADIVDDFKKMSLGKDSKRAFTDTQLIHEQQHGVKEHPHHHHHHHPNSHHNYHANRKHSGAGAGAANNAERSYSSYDSQNKEGGGYYSSNMKYNTLSNKKYSPKYGNNNASPNNYRQNSGGNNNNSNNGGRTQTQNSASNAGYQGTGGGYRQSKSSTASIASLQGNSPQQTLCRFGNACKFKKIGKCRYLHPESPVGGASLSAAHSTQNIATAQDNSSPRSSTDFEPQQQQQTELSVKA